MFRFVKALKKKGKKKFPLTSFRVKKLIWKKILKRKKVFSLKSFYLFNRLHLFSLGESLKDCLNEFLLFSYFSKKRSKLFGFKVIFFEYFDRLMKGFVSSTSTISPYIISNILKKPENFLLNLINSYNKIQFKPIVLNSSLIVNLKYFLNRGSVRRYNLISGLRRKNYNFINRNNFSGFKKSFYYRKQINSYVNKTLYSLNEKLFERREMGRLFTPLLIDSSIFFYLTKLIFNSNLQYRLFLLRFQFVNSLFSEQLPKYISFHYNTTERNDIWKTNLFFRYIPLMVMPR